MTSRPGWDSITADASKRIAQTVLLEEPRDMISVTVKRAQQLTGLSHTTIYKLAGEGRLRLVKVGRRTLVTYASLRGLIDG